MRTEAPCIGFDRLVDSLPVAGLAPHQVTVKVFHESAVYQDRGEETPCTIIKNMLGKMNAADAGIQQVRDMNSVGHHAHYYLHEAIPTRKHQAF
jgi:hypothetical protein